MLKPHCAHYLTLRLIKFCAKFGCSLVLRTASAHNSFIVLRCTWKEPAPLNITVNGQLQFVLSSELSSFSVKHGHMCYHDSLNVALPVPTFIKTSSSARDNIVPSLCGNNQKLWYWMINTMFLLWSWLEKISKNRQNKKGIKEDLPRQFQNFEFPWHYIFNQSTSSINHLFQGAPPNAPLAAGMDPRQEVILSSSSS